MPNLLISFVLSITVDGIPATVTSIKTTPWMLGFPVFTV